jgi:hypothetical protein
MLIHVHHVVIAIQLHWGNSLQGFCLANGWYKNQRQQWQCRKEMIQTIQQKRSFERESRRISALSAFDGSVVDYRGDNGYGELGFDSGEGA